MSCHLTDVCGQKTIMPDLQFDTKMNLFRTLLRAHENIAGALRVSSNERKCNVPWVELWCRKRREPFRGRCDHSTAECRSDGAALKAFSNQYNQCPISDCVLHASTAVQISCASAPRLSSQSSKLTPTARQRLMTNLVCWLVIYPPDKSKVQAFSLCAYSLQCYLVWAVFGLSKIVLMQSVINSPTPIQF